MPSVSARPPKQRAIRGNYTGSWSLNANPWYDMQPKPYGRHTGISAAAYQKAQPRRSGAGMISSMVTKALSSTKRGANTKPVSDTLPAGARRRAYFNFRPKF